MTIAVGLLANGGVVLAADTQLTIQNFWKGHGGKIVATARRHKEPTGVCAITGATNFYDCLHGFGDDLSSEFFRNLDTSDKATAYAQFDVVLRRFYRRHVAPITGEVPDVQVLMRVMVLTIRGRASASYSLKEPI